VHDKTVRRRRAVLALLVALSLILISASFGSSSSSGLHTVQAGFLDILSPIESGANKVLTPVHDLINWVGDVFNAADQRDRYRKRWLAAESELARLQTAVRNSANAAAIQHADDEANLASDRPITANVNAGPENLFVPQIVIDQGSGAGVRVGDPVIDGPLVGTVSEVAADSAKVTLISASSAAEDAVDNRSSVVGQIKPDPGNTTLLELVYADPTKVKVGDQIVTAGDTLTGGASLYPPSLLIGTVKSVPPPGNSTGTITVAPAADLGALETVQVLTRVHG
jgi:rod shape-determining protein MreC